MKFSEIESQRTANVLKGTGPLFAKVLGVALLVALSSVDFANAQGNSRRLMRQFGFDKTYSGVMRGLQSYRTTGATPFETDRISRLKRFRVPVATREVVSDPQGEGEYRILNSTRVNRRRATIRGQYFGVGQNPRTGNPPGVPAKFTTRTGQRILRIRANTRQRRVVTATYRDRIVEYDRDEINVILARWQVRGTLR